MMAGQSSPTPPLTLTRYLAIGLISIVLTLLAIWVVTTHQPFKHSAVTVIVVLAVIQASLQLFLFMRLTGRRLYSAVFGFGVLMALLFALAPVLIINSSGKAVATAKLSTRQMLAEGQQIALNTCESCHKINGTGGSIGPDLNQVLAGQINLVPGGQPTNDAWLARWIADPSAVWSGAKMPNLGLTSQQIQSVIVYLKKDVK